MSKKRILPSIPKKYLQGNVDNTKLPTIPVEAQAPLASTPQKDKRGRSSVAFSTILGPHSPALTQQRVGVNVRQMRDFRAASARVDLDRSFELGGVSPRRKNGKKKLAAGELPTSQNHIISDKTLGDVLEHSIEKMIEFRGNSELFERKKNAILSFIDKIYHFSEVAQKQTARAMFATALEGRQVQDFVRYITSTASNNAVEGDASSNSGIGSKMDASLDSQGRLLAPFELVRTWFLEMSNVLTLFPSLQEGKLLRDKKLQAKVLDAISPDLVAGGIRSSSRILRDRKIGDVFEAPSVLTGDHDRNFRRGSVSGAIAGLTPPQARHVAQGLVHRRSATPDHTSFDEDALNASFAALDLSAIPREDDEHSVLSEGDKHSVLSSDSSSSEVFQMAPHFDLDVFNYVQEGLNLTQQNVDFLLRNALKKMGHSDEEVDSFFRSQFMMTPISNDNSLDHGLRDAILNFLGQEIRQERFTILMCVGTLGEDNQITGNTHWTTLHLRRNGDQIEVFHMNSLGENIPVCVNRVLNEIKETTFEDLQESDGVVSNHKIRAIENLASVEFSRARSLVCDRQKDGSSCGYHSVFNALTTHFSDDVREERAFLPQDQAGRNVEDFIKLQMVDLKERFNEGIDLLESVEVDEFVNSLRFGWAKNEKFDSIFYDRTNSLMALNKIAADSSLVNVEKIIMLWRLEEMFAEKADDDFLNQAEIIGNLSALELQKFYAKFMVGCLEEIKFSAHKNDPKILRTNFEMMSQKITSSEIVSNLNIGIISGILDFYDKRTNKNFNTLCKALGLRLSKIDVMGTIFEESDEGSQTESEEFEKESEGDLESVCSFLSTQPSPVTKSPSGTRSGSPSSLSSGSEIV